jgi:cytochrome b561
MSDDALDAAARRRFSTVAILLHWLIAVVIVTNMVVGFQADDLKGLAKFSLLQWHKSFGVTVLVLTLLRLVWRVFTPHPAYPAHMADWEKGLAGAVHWSFYVLMIALPVTGWVMVSASPTNIPTILYKAIPWPHIGAIHSLPIGQRKGLEHQVADVHEQLAWGTILLLVMHVAAALKHQFIDRDQVLWRIAPLGLLKPRIMK